MIETLLPRLRTPNTGVSPLRIVTTAQVERAPAIGLSSAVLAGPDGQDPSVVELGVWQALGRGDRAPRTLAQLTNVIPPAPELYEVLWRRRSLSTLSRRAFPIHEEIDEMVAALGGDVVGAFIVDVGCSEGLYARHLARRGAQVAAIDHSRPFLRRALQRAAQCGVQIGAIRALAERLPVGGATAHGVVIGGSFNEFADPSRALAETGRVLRPGGRLFMMSLVAAGSTPGRFTQFGLRPSGIRFPTSASTLAAVERAGLTILDQRLDGVVSRITAARPG